VEDSRASAARSKLAGHEVVEVTLIDGNNYHQFEPLLYQVATSQLAASAPSTEREPEHA
jgi:NADH dehydrogenase